MRETSKKFVFWTILGIFILQAQPATAGLSRGQTEDILMTRTNQYLAKRNFHLSDSNWDFFRRAIERAADDISKQRPVDQPAELEKASTNIHLFIDVMIQKAIHTKGYGYRLGESTLAEAQSSLCPLWPFC